MREHLQSYLEGTTVPFATTMEYIAWLGVGLGIIVVGLIILYLNKRTSLIGVMALSAGVVFAVAAILCWSLGTTRTIYPDATELSNDLKGDLTNEYRISQVKLLAQAEKATEAPEDYVLPEEAMASPESTDFSVSTGVLSEETALTWLSSLEDNDWTSRPLVYVLTEDNQKVVYEIGFDENDQLTLYPLNAIDQVDPETLRR